jgi:hypothetical protein
MPLEKKFPREEGEPYLPPVGEVLNLRQKGFSKDQIASSLERDNYSQNQIVDAITQADIKRSIAGKYPYSEQANTSQLENMAPSPQFQDMEPSTQPEQDMDYSEPLFQQQPLMPVSQPGYQEEHVEELVESVVNEKWEDLTNKIGDLAVWKESTKNEMESIKQEILRFEQRLENLQKAVIGKVSDYDKDIKAIGTDIKALEQVLQKILSPLTINVKELSRLAEIIKKKKDSKKKK